MRLLENLHLLIIISIRTLKRICKKQILKKNYMDVREIASLCRLLEEPPQGRALPISLPMVQLGWC